MKSEIAIVYKIVGKVDGRWTVYAYDNRGKLLGIGVEVASPSEAWRVWMMLNGYSDAEPTMEIFEHRRTA